MSKTVPKNIFTDLSTISGRIVKVLIDRGLVKRDGSPNLSDAERKAGIKGTVLQKAVKRDGGLYDDNLDKFLRTFHVKRDWLLKGIGDMNEENPTPAMKSTDNKETAIRGHVYTDLIEHNSDYKLMPTMLLTDYSIIPKRILEGHEKEIARQDGLIAKYEGYISRLEKEIESLRSQLIPKNAQ